MSRTLAFSPAHNAAVATAKECGAERETGCRRAAQLLVNGKLFCWLLHFDGDLQVGLINAEILPICLESRRNHLHAHFAIRNARCFRLAVFMGLQLHTFLFLLAVVVEEMENN